MNQQRHRSVGVFVRPAPKGWVVEDAWRLFQGDANEAPATVATSSGLEHVVGERPFLTAPSGNQGHGHHRRPLIQSPPARHNSPIPCSYSCDAAHPVRQPQRRQASRHVSAHRICAITTGGCTNHRAHIARPAEGSAKAIDRPAIEEIAAQCNNSHSARGPRRAPF